ncbi:Mor transcription activator family protein [Pseudomonas putida]|uniref:Mor transcription activator family protein n=1 Tax=Pseudomonas TaxID=286 RepID=UPI002B05E62B|nr:Mor transcription activator family protein [Pseudomonas guariconensis]
MQNVTKSLTPDHGTANYTNSMIEMIEIIEHAIDVEMERDASPAHLANATVLALCRVLGGTAVYVPKAAAFKKSIRDKQMFKDFRAGMTVREIAKKHKTSTQLVYDIIGEQRNFPRLPTEIQDQSNE